MTNEYSNTDFAARLTHLQRVVVKECRYLICTAEGLKQADPEFRWLDALEQNAGLTERLDAFVSRFCRLQDTWGDNYFPSFCACNLSPSEQFRTTSTVLKN
jgi:hypothetical protein